MRRLQQRLSRRDPALAVGCVLAQPLLLQPITDLHWAPAGEGSVGADGAGGEAGQRAAAGTGGALWPVTHLSLGWGDQPSRGPAVALTPPLWNSPSAGSSGLKVVEWLLFSLQQQQQQPAVSPGGHTGATCSKGCVRLPAEELPEAARLLLGLRRGRRLRGGAIVWFPVRDAGQVQVLGASPLRLAFNTVKTTPSYFTSHVNLLKHVSVHFKDKT